MPPKAKITREMILNAALAITQKEGFEAVNARSIAGRLGCSTRPIFTCYAGMEELKRDFLLFSFDFYEAYAAGCAERFPAEPCLLHPLAYLAFAREEPLLFQFLFVRDMDLQMGRAEDFYREPGNEKKARVFSEQIGLDFAAGKEIFLDLFLYTHGMAVLTAAGKLALSRQEAGARVQSLLSALIARAKRASEAET